MSDHVRPDEGDTDPTRVSSHDGRTPTPMPTPRLVPSRRYRPLRLHARGSLGQVHVARDEELNREVALKELQDHCAENVDARIRFLREAEITASLEHPCIVPVYGRGYHTDGRPFYAMRFVRGESLDAALKAFHLKNGDLHGLAFRDLLTRFVAICDAIAYAHSLNVIHRDLKPSNVMLGKFGETLVVDWGLARQCDRPEGPLPSTDEIPILDASPSATHAGQIVGTPAYMSPEQAAGRSVGPASDVYSLGGILYAILTGQPPMPHGVAPLLLLSECDRTPPSPRSVARGVPAALDAVCMRAMAHDPDKRYASADELASDVRRYLADEPVSARREPLGDRWRRWSRRNRSLLTGAVMLLVAGVIGLGVGLWAVDRERDAAVRAGQRADEEKGRADKQRDEAVSAGKRADAEKDRAEQNFTRAETALAEAQKNLVQADKNLQLARTAVDDCFVLATGDVGMSQEAAAPFRRRLLAAARPYYKEFQSRRPGDASFDLDLARNLGRLASIESGLGETDEARVQGNKARELCARIAKRDDLSAEEVRSLADCTNNVGSVLHAIGDLAAAVEVLTLAYALHERLLGPRPDDVRARFHLIKTAHNLGLVEGARGRTTQSKEWYLKALKDGEALGEKHPTNAEFVGQHVSTWRSYAGLLERDGAVDEADEAYKKGERVGDSLSKLQALRADDLRTLATTYSDHAALLSNRGNPARAKPLFLKAIALQEIVCRQFPETRFLYDLGIMTANLGRVCELLQLRDEALVAWDRSRRVWAEIASRRPKDETGTAGLNEASRRWSRIRVTQVDRLIAQGDASGAASEVVMLATESPPCKPGLINYAGLCGRWLIAFGKDANVSDAQRRRMTALGAALLEQAKAEKTLTAEVLEWVRRERSFAPLRETEGYKKVVGEGKGNE